MSDPLPPRGDANYQVGNGAPTPYEWKASSLLLLGLIGLKTKQYSNKDITWVYLNNLL